MSEILDAAKLAAIARIERRVAGLNPELLGTGFLVGDGLLLTAWHVVKRFDRQNPPANETLHVKLRDAEGPGHVVARGTTAQLDWALIECAAAKGRAPLLLRRLPFSASHWRTFGYARESGAYLGGEIRGLRGAELDLEVRELSSSGSTVKGASGSPVIASGVVIGMLVREVRDSDTDASVNQAAKALASEAIVADAGGRLTLRAGELPFTAAFASELRRNQDAWDGVVDELRRYLDARDGGGQELRRYLDAWDGVGQELGVSPGGDPPVTLARALVSAGLVAIRKALQGVQVNGILFEIAEALWVNDQAAWVLHNRIQQPGCPRAIGLDAKTIATGRHYVLRAEAPCVKQFPTWHTRALEIQLVSSELTGRSLTDELVERIRAKIGPDKETDEDVNDWLEANGPIVLLITSDEPLPPELPEELAAVEARFPRVCALLLVGPEREPPPPMALIEPRLGPTFDEKRLHKRICNTRG